MFLSYDNIKNIELTVDILKKHNIKHFVISPGGTNIPLIKKIQDDNFFDCYSIVDERSAVYFAIGIYLQTGAPVAMLCTSAQATRNYIPGLTEAYYKRVPILAITMEKHPRFKYQEYMQAPDQTSLPKDSVKKSFELPFITDINDVYHSKRLINEAVLELNNNGKGPVQLCIPWLDFKIAEVEPSNTMIERIEYDSSLKVSLKGKRVLVVIGEHRPFSEAENNAIDYFCKNTNSAIYVNHLSNYHNEYSINGNFLMSSIDSNTFNKLIPDILISIGGQTGDYPFYLKFSKTEYQSIEHWRVSEDGRIADTYDKLTKTFHMSEQDFFLCVEEDNSNTHEFFELWKEECDRLDSELSVPYSNVSIAQYLHNRIPSNSIIQFSILNSLRVWNLFKLDSSIECYSNVGAFGIDGGMSTLIGQSVISDKKAFMIIGDLAFFYDMNSLGIRHIKNNLRIILINNNGGIEFKLHGEDCDKTNRYIAAADHFKDAKGWAEDCGFLYLKAGTMEEFVSASQILVEDSDKPIILEAFIKDRDERDAYNLLIDNNKKFSAKDFLKKSVKRIINKD